MEGVSWPFSIALLGIEIAGKIKSTKNPPQTESLLGRQDGGGGGENLGLYHVGTQPGIISVDLK